MIVSLYGASQVPTLVFPGKDTFVVHNIHIVRWGLPVSGCKMQGSFSGIKNLCL